MPTPSTPSRDSRAEPRTEAGRCGGCGGPHQFDTSVPSPSWNRVIRAAGMSEFLCTTCIVLAFVKAGESFEAELYGAAVDRPDHMVPLIRVQVDDRPIDQTYGDLEYRLREAAALPGLTEQIERLPRAHHGMDGMDTADDGVWIERSAVLALVAVSEAAALDVERLARALSASIFTGNSDPDHLARRIAAEYALLATPATEPQP